MKFPYIENYVGKWKDEDGNRLIVEKLNDETAMVSFYTSPVNKPILRPWYNNKPSLDMSAKYYPEVGPELVVDLWEPGKGFSLNLNFEPEYLLDNFRNNSIAPTLSRYEEDNYLDQYYGLFGRLRHYIIENTESSDCL
jgi:hypothetical protein